VITPQETGTLIYELGLSKALQNPGVRISTLIFIYINIMLLGGRSFSGRIVELLKHPLHPSRIIPLRRLHVEIRCKELLPRAGLGLGALVFKEGYIDVEEVLGLRLHMEGENPRPEYLVKWKVSFQHSPSMHE
jgi:hypothetical protein